MEFLFVPVHDFLIYIQDFSLNVIIKIFNGRSYISLCQLFGKSKNYRVTLPSFHYKT